MLKKGLLMFFVCYIGIFFGAGCKKKVNTDNPAEVEETTNDDRRVPQ